MRRWKPRLKFTPSVFAFCITLCLCLFVLYANPKIGMADNGDFYRIMVSNDLMHLPERPVDDFFSYYNSEYRLMQYYNPLSQTVHSTHSLIIQLAIGLNQLVFHGPIFHIEFLSIQLVLVLATGIAVLVDEVYPFFKSTWAQYFSALLAVIVFADSGYTAYFNSFYGESIAYPFFVLSVAAFIKFAKGKSTIQFLWLGIFVGATFMFIGSKNQYAASGLLAALLLIVLVPLILRGKRAHAILALTCAGLLLVGSAYFFSQIDERIFTINKYHSITRGVILHQPKADYILKELGLSPGYEMLQGSVYFDYTPTIHPLDKRLKGDFYSRYNLVKLTGYYLTHPEDLRHVFELGGKNSFTIRPEVLGNYERQLGKQAGDQTNTFTMWSVYKEKMMPHKFKFLMFCTIIALGLSVLRFYQKRLYLDRRHRIASELIWIYVIGIGLSQILVSIIGAGDTDLKKHLFMVGVAFDLLVYYNGMYLLSEFNPSEKY